MRTVHIISHTHWDREWYRTFQLFRLKLVHLVDGLLKLLDDDPEFKYFMLDGQTIVLDDYLAMRPEKEDILRKHIQRGRIIIGPWHILPDTFLVGPEAHIRNLLEGDRTAGRFEQKMMIGYLPDPFGHPGQIPQILKGFGIETACLWRGLDEEPAEFWWQAPDGSRVLMVYLRDSYSNGAGLPVNNLPDFAQAVAHETDKLAPHSAVSDYLIMFGTDHMEPPLNTSNAIAFANDHIPDTRVLHSTLPRFVEAITEAIRKNKTDLQMVEGELRQCRRSHLLPGVLSTRMWIKQRNHASEDLLLKWVEPFSTFASFIAIEKRSPSTLDEPAGLVRKTWRLLMENHPHDSICGCSVDQVHKEMGVRFDQVDQIGEELTLQSLESLAANIDTRSGQGASAVVVFNPLSSPRTDMVTTSLELPAKVTDFELVDEAGQTVPFQAGGTGQRELICMNMSVKEFQSAFGFINDGHAAGMAIQGLKIRKEGTAVYIDAIVSEGGEPNMEVWKVGRKQVDDYLTDPSITTYQVRALSAAETQISFTTGPIPGLGYKTLWVRSLPTNGSQAQTMSPLMKLALPLARLPLLQSLASRRKPARPPYKIENEFFIVEVQPDGNLSVLDKRTQAAFTGLNSFQDGADCGDEYNFAPPAHDQIITPSLKRVFLAQGDVCQSLEVELELVLPISLSLDRQSRADQKVAIPIRSIITLTKGVSRVDIRTTVNNTARDHRLRVHFPAPFLVEKSVQDGHFEVVERTLGLPDADETWIELPRPEAPQRAFTDLSDEKTGLMVANRGLPEVEVLKNMTGNGEIALTLLRCVGWLSRDDFSTRKGHAGPGMETPQAQMPGEWSFDYSIIPHAGTWKEAFPHAYAFDTPMRAVNTRVHEGKLPASASLVAVEPATFVVSTVKWSEDGRGWLVRGYNVTSDDINVSIRPSISFQHAEKVNLCEQKLEPIPPAEDGSVSFQVRGHEIVSVLFRD